MEFRSRRARIMLTAWTVLCVTLLMGHAAATEVHLNSGRNGESTSQTTVVTAATEAAEKAAETVTTKPSGDTSDLDKAETKDPTKKLDIIKQIRKINKDGSYTVGYEAGDGTFKIESRDVLGNIKGTYGYVDANGEIKRVSYHGNNETTALKSFPNEVAADAGELTTTQSNMIEGRPAPPSSGASTVRTSLRSMRRPPQLKYLSTTAAPFGTKSNYIQSIPKRRLGVPSSTERSQYSHYSTSKTTERSNTHESASSTTRAPPRSVSDEQQTPTTIVYAKTVPTSKPMIILRPTTQATSTSQTQEQISRPDRLEINHVSKVMVMKSSETSTSKSINADKEADRKSIRGNNLRRQLAQEREDHFEAQPQQLYTQNAGEDAQHIFDGGNLRPLYSTTTRPRVPSIVLAARQRAAQLQNALNTNSAPTTTTEKVYVRPPPAAVQYETTTSEPTQESNYLTQSPSGTVVQIPANQAISQQATEDQGSIYGQRPAPFSLRQQQGNHPGPYQTEGPPNSLYRFPPPPSARGEQFLRETSPSPSSHKHREDAEESVYGRQAALAQRSRSGSPYDNDNPYQQGSFPVPFQQNPYGFYPGAQQSAAPGFNFPQRPVTTRDFEMLLQLLVNRHQTPRFGFGAGGGGFNPYGGGGGVGSPYLSNMYGGGYQRPFYDPVGYDPLYGPNYGGFRQYSEPQNSIYGNQGGVQGGAPDASQSQQYDNRGGFPRQRPFSASNYNIASSYPSNYPYQQQQQQQQLQPQQQQQFPQRAGAPFSPQRQPPYYQPETTNIQPSYSAQASTQQDYLPPDVREDLLYRMLMLAIQGPGGNGLESQAQPQIGAFSDPIKSVINTPVAAPVAGQSAAAAGPSVHHNHRSNFVQPATRKPVRSVQILGESEE